jgi:hypothetical protein
MPAVRWSCPDSLYHASCQMKLSRFSVPCQLSDEAVQILYTMPAVRWSCPDSLYQASCQKKLSIFSVPRQLSAETVQILYTMPAVRWSCPDSLYHASCQMELSQVVVTINLDLTWQNMPAPSLPPSSKQSCIVNTHVNWIGHNVFFYGIPPRFWESLTHKNDKDTVEQYANDRGHVCRARICKLLIKEPRNRFQGTDSASLAESMNWNRFLGSLNDYKFGLWLHTPMLEFVEQSMGARNRVGIGLSCRPDRLKRLAESIPGLLKSLKMPTLGSLNVGHRSCLAFKNSVRFMCCPLIWFLITYNSNVKIVTDIQGCESRRQKNSTCTRPSFRENWKVLSLSLSLSGKKGPRSLFAARDSPPPIMHNAVICSVARWP